MGNEDGAAPLKMCLDCRSLYTDDDAPCPGHQPPEAAIVLAFEGMLKLRIPPANPGVPTLCALAEFFAEDGQQVMTVNRAVIRMDAAELAWAELTMFADAAGRPVLDIPADPAHPGVHDLTGLIEDGPGGGEIRTRTFRYLIEFVSERPAPTEAVASQSAG